ncbi:MAG TPA: hypothetical protein VII67_04265 [Acidimicrobiales bacterium]
MLVTPLEATGIAHHETRSPNTTSARAHRAVELIVPLIAPTSSSLVVYHADVGPFGVGGSARRDLQASN